MRYAVLADIHSNLEALTAALGRLQSEKIDEYLVLGDIVGYGPDPNECLRIVAGLNGTVIGGNHDKALYDDEILSQFSHDAAEAVRWTRTVLDPSWHDYVYNLPLTYTGESFTLTHGSIDYPEYFQYLFYFGDAAASFRRLSTPVGWFGHTHVPTLFAKKQQTAEYLHEGAYPLDKKETYLINPGSLGQPRDRDPRLSFAIFDDQAYNLQIVRLTYDNQETARKIRAAGLPAFLADRLL